MKNEKKRFRNTFKFCNNDINKSILLLRKGVYPYKYCIWINGKSLMKHLCIKKKIFMVT